MSNKYDIDFSYEHKTACPKCRDNGMDSSGDNLHVYGMDSEGKSKGAYCHACEFTIPSDEWLEDHGQVREEEYELMGSAFNESVHEALKARTGLDPKGYRSIPIKTSKFFGVRYEYDEGDGSVAKVYYPCTMEGIEGKLSGYKVRAHPKNFAVPGPIGETGKDCQLFGQHRFESFGNTVVIVGGEHDQLAAYAMLESAQKNKDWDAPAVVSPTVGESGSYKQIQKQYEFFNRFKKIILCYDNDKAGEEAAQKAAAVLPRGRVYLMRMRYKDPNDYLMNGKSSEFVSDYWNAKLWTPAGVHASTTLYDSALSYAENTKLSLPPFLPKTAEMYSGGLVKGEITIIFAKTSIGKTTYVNNFTINWALNDTDEVVGVLSLEAVVDKYATSIFSDYLGVKLIKMDTETRKAYLHDFDVVEKIKKLTEREDGTARFFVCDDRGGEIETIKDKILEMIIKMGVTVLIIDPFSDLMDGLDISQQAEFSSWMKKVLKEYPHVSLVLVAHVRKGQKGDTKPLTEDDIMGSSTLAKSAAQSISLERDKLHDNPIMRNVTQVTIHKNRHFGETGPSDQVYYDWKTGKLHNFEEWKENNPQEVQF